jgi:uncharacterized membrane protein (DUF106 family)
MMDAINNFILRIADPLLNWLLLLPSDLALITLAIGSSAVLAIVRKWTTNQDLLNRCVADKQRLKTLMKEAKASGDKAALQRYRTSQGLVGLKQFGQEGKPLLVAIVPLAILATWAFHRLEFHPPKAGEAVDVIAHFPASAAGKLVHIVPVGEVENGWIREIAANGEAHWRVRLPADASQLQFRYGEATYVHPVSVGQTTYLPALLFHDEKLDGTEVRLRPVKLFGIVPGIPQIGLAAWMIGYLLIVIPFVPLLKRLLRIR